MKKTKLKTKRSSKEAADANFALQHAVVRGESSEEITRLTENLKKLIDEEN